MQLKTNTTLQNYRYSVKSCIGDGGFGITYLARDNKLEREVVLKEYFPDYMAKRDTTVSNEVHTLSTSQESELKAGIAKFMKEARTLALLNDIPAIATVYDFFEENNTAYIVMEYIKGKNLKQYIKERSTAYSFDEAMYILEPCMFALQKVHEAGIIHRDFAPDNIIINDKGQVKIIDFGASRDYVSSGATMTVMVKHGYAPAEQYSNAVKQGPYTDVYSLSAILYEMLTLKKPIPSIDRVFADQLEKPRELNPAITPAQEEVVMKGLSPNYEQRYQTINDMLNAIKGLENENTIMPGRNPAYRSEILGANISSNGSRDNVNYNSASGNYQGIPASSGNIKVVEATEIAAANSAAGGTRGYVSSTTPQVQPNATKKSEAGKIIAIICAAAAVLVVLICVIVITSTTSNSTAKTAEKKTHTTQEVQEEKEKEEENSEDKSEKSVAKEETVDGLAAEETYDESKDEPSEESNDSDDLPKMSRHAPEKAIIIRISTSSQLDVKSKDGATYSPQNMIDGNVNTAWIEGKDGLGIGEFIYMEFDEIKNISEIDIYPGFLKTKYRYSINGQPTRLLIEWDGGQTEMTLDRAYVGENEEPFQADELPVDKVFFEGEVQTGFLRLTILDAIGGSKYTDVAISEIEVYALSD